MDNKSLDQILYEAYSESIRETFNLPVDVVILWSDLPPELVDGWRVAAEAAKKWAHEEEVAKDRAEGYEYKFKGY